jgi:hypothetical protein
MRMLFGSLRAGSLVVLASLLTGCAVYVLEYDRMVGTTFPQPQTVSGQTVSLRSIYLDAGYSLVVDEGDTNIAALPNEYVNEAELDTIEATHRSSPIAPRWRICLHGGILPYFCEQYYVWGVVVNHFYEDNDGNPMPDVMGRMWTFANRRAFVNFYKHPFCSDDPGRYLRSTAHEIGHAFNLHHPDGTDDPSSLMNTTADAGPAYTYRFSVNSMDHLTNHPARCVRPGVGSFSPTLPSCHTHFPYAALTNPVCN